MTVIGQCMFLLCSVFLFDLTNTSYCCMHMLIMLSNMLSHLSFCFRMPKSKEFISSSESDSDSDQVWNIQRPLHLVTNVLKYGAKTISSQNAVHASLSDAAGACTCVERGYLMFQTLHHQSWFIFYSNHDTPFKWP